MLGICNDSLTKTQEKYKLNLNLIKLGALRWTTAPPASWCNQQTHIQRTRGKNIILKTADITVMGEQGWRSGESTCLPPMSTPYVG